MKKYSLLLSVCLLLVMQALGINKPDSTTTNGFLPKNIIKSDAEFWLLGGSINVGYERIIHSSGKNTFTLSGDYGRWAMLFDKGDLVSLSGNYFRGKGAHHFEMDLGAVLLVHYDLYYGNRKQFDHFTVLPDLFLGYRYQKPSGRLMFKAGTGFPGLLTAGLGVAF